MALSRVEDMTIGEISDRVDASNAAADLREDANRARLIKDTTQKILDIVAIKTAKGDPHPFRPGKYGCASCRYEKDHPIHQDA